MNGIVTIRPDGITRGHHDGRDADWVERYFQSNFRRVKLEFNGWN